MSEGEYKPYTEGVAPLVGMAAGVTVAIGANMLFRGGINAPADAIAAVSTMGGLVGGGAAGEAVHRLELKLAGRAGKLRRSNNGN